MEKSSKSSGGIGFLGLLAILFIGLKLTGHITWSWWLVLSPLWGGFALVLAVLAVCSLVVGIAELVTYRRRRGAR